MISPGELRAWSSIENTRPSSHGLSTLPFAIGQVQDAGLIFLGKMAKEVADALDGEELEDIVATTLAGLCGATALDRTADSDAE